MENNILEMKYYNNNINIVTNIVLIEQRKAPLRF